MTTSASGDRERVRLLNDELRQLFVGGAIVCSRGIDQLPPREKRAVLDAVRSFAAFDLSNDPYEEHDFGFLEAGGQRVAFKIDYFDRDMTHGSPDPSDPHLTLRVLTIMLADEY